MSELPEPGPGRDPDTARETAERILAGADFDDGRSVPERILGWIGDRLADIVGGLGAGGGGPVLVLFVFIALIAVVALVVWAILNRRRVTAGVRVQRPDPAVVVTTLRDHEVDWAAEAAAAERDGRWADAVRARYRAAAAVLSDAGHLDDAPTGTAGEQRRRLAEGAPDLSEDFAAVADRFEAAWYGAAEPAEADATETAARARRIGERLRA